MTLLTDVAMSLSNLLSRLEKSSSYMAVIKAIQGGARELCISGLWGSSRSCLVTSLRRRFPFPSLFITSTGEEAEKTEEDLRSISEDEVHLFPAWETLPGEDLSPHSDIMADRLIVLEKLLHYNFQPSAFNSQLLIVAPFPALLNGVASPPILRSCLIRLSVGQIVARDKLMRELVAYGYEPAAMVEERGDFSRRGGILDIYPSTGEHPLRLEFFADTIESIRFFSITSQRSLEKIDQATILPRSELALRSKAPDLTTLLSYFPRDSLIFLDEPARIRVISHQSQFSAPSGILPSSFPSALGGRIKVRGRIHPTGDKGRHIMPEADPPGRECRPYNYSFNQVLAACREKRLIYTSLLPQTIPEMKSVPIQRFPVQSLETYRGQFQELTSRIKSWRDDGYRVIFACNNEGEKGRLKELLKERNIEIKGELSICVGCLQSGFLFPEIKLALLTDAELFARYRLRRPRRRFKGGFPVSHFGDLQEGDYLVHINQGIGKYLGVERLLTDGRERDFLVLEYLDKDKLYVPVEELHLVQKYVGVEG
ncbi:hypothetical protein LR013_01395, partial [candidate division NPL-UPA2 bacterium]|nr:hypothetical protein [candidate division NPL-UPA2 bacterium]